MSASLTTERIAESSPRFKARIAGVLYLLIFVAAPFDEFFVRGRLIVYGDPAATAASDSRSDGAGARKSRESLASSDTRSDGC
jgi:hypothetical protein